MDGKDGASGFIANLHLYEITLCRYVSQGASGLQVFHQKDTTILLGCLNQTLRSKLLSAV
jgi:hypothetical protein